MSEIKRKLATVQKIAELRPIEGADKIEVAIVKGWHIVTQKGNFKEGDLCIFFEIDSLLPDIPFFEFMRPYKFRIRTIKLRGQVSQGLILPIKDFLESPDTPLALLEQFPMYEGADVTDKLGVTKYEPPIPANLAGDVVGMFPSFIPKTDEERIQNIPEVLDLLRNKEVYITEKIDGSSMTVYLKRREGEPHEFGVCTRNMNLKETEGNSLWKLARQLNLEEALLSLQDDMAIQGEIHGEGIQGNKYKLKGQHFRVFNIFNISSGQSVTPRQMENIINDLLHKYSPNLETVPILRRDFLILPRYTVDDIVELSEGTSEVGEAKPQREGLVFRPVEDIHYMNSRISFKAISPKFLLKHEE